MVPPDTFLGLIPNGVAVYFISVLAMSISFYTLYKRVFRLVLLGRYENRFDRPVKRLWNTVKIVVLQTRVLQRLSWKDMAGLGHIAIFYGFISFLLSYLVFIFGDSAWGPFSETILTHTGVVIFSSYLDIVAIVILGALIWAIIRRWVVSPHRLSFDLTRSLDAVIIVGAISILMLLTLATEAFYVASGGTGPASSALIGKFLGGLVESTGISETISSVLHGISWWAHLLVILGFGIYIPFSKHMHMVASPINAFFTTLDARGTLKPLPDMDSVTVFGAGGTQGFTWKQILDGYACAVCGRCTDNCPAHLSGKTLSPMHIAEGIKEHAQEAGPQIIDANKKGQQLKEQDLFGGMFNQTAVWDCVTCGACMEECPVAVEHVDSIVEMRRYLVMEKAEMPEGVQSVLLNLEQRGHPWRGSQASRDDWMKDMNVRSVSEDSDVEVLLWVGCTPALNEPNQRVPRAMADLLNAANVKFGVLGLEEVCSGDPARRMGNEYLYEILARQNINTFDKYNIKKIVTLCPHCFNNIKNEYPQLGGEYTVYHYSEYLDELIRDGRLKPSKSVDMVMTYHDSCYLGRHNKIYDQPRSIAKSIPGLTLVEMQLNREKGFCCGAGGGHMWMEDSSGRRMSHMRTEQFMDTEGDTLGVSCPFCLQMFEEGIQSNPSADKKQTKDLLEVLRDSVIGEDHRSED